MEYSAADYSRHCGPLYDIVCPVEIIFEVTEDPVDGGFVASTLGHGITTEADTLTDLRQMVRDAVQCHFHDAQQIPKIIRLHFVRDEVLSL